MSLGHGASIVRDGLVLHLDAANVKSYPGSGTTWYDVSGNGNNATLVNSPLHEDGLFKFDGVSDYADTGYVWSNLYLGGSFMVFGYNTTSNTNDIQGHHAGRRFYWGLGNTLHHGVQNTFLNTASSPIGNGQPFSIASTYAGGTTSDFYVNGDKFQTLTGISNSSSSSPNGNWLIGTGDDNGGNINQYRDYQIGVVMFYNRALTADEVRRNYEALRGRYGV